MHIRTWTITLVLTLSVLLGGVRVTAQPPRPSEAPAPAATPVETLLNPDGTLRLDGSFSGALDVSGWQVTLDPEQGPIFQSQSGAPRWTNLGSMPDGALNNQVLALAVSGTDVYVGGSFTNVAGIPQADYVARWDTTTNTWSALGGDANGALDFGSVVHALAVSGSNVYVGGSFWDAAGIPQADLVARWNATTNTWSALGGSGSNGALTGGVGALAVSGGTLYVGGWFTDAAGIPEADYVARWDGSAWSALGGSGNGALTNQVHALAVSGSNVYVGGSFWDAAGIPQADRVARWNATTNTWSALGGSGSNGALTGGVGALAVSGSNVYVGGNFQNAAGLVRADFVARLDTTTNTWSALGGGSSTSGALTGGVRAVAVSGGELFVGGDFWSAANIFEATFAARWNGSAWSALEAGGGYAAPSGNVYALAVSGSDVYVGGRFWNAAGIPQADYVARWNSMTNTWSALGGGVDGALDGEVTALAVNGGDVYAGGRFTDAAGIPEADYVARWDGSSWSALGGSGGNGALNDTVTALAVNGGDVYAGGFFQDAASIAEADYVARWNATTNTWSALGGSGGNGAVTGLVLALAMNGSHLYVGGRFTDAAGIPEADYVARWDGSSWSALGGSGGNGALNDTVTALAVNGGDVYAGGWFTDAAGIPEADYVARWNGSSWSALGGSGGNGALNNGVRSLTVSGNDLFAGGFFQDAAGNLAADFVAAYATPPSVSAITRVNPNPTSAASVQFQVAFDEPVTGVAASDFTLTTTGSLSGASVTGVSGSGATYTVTVATGTGDGTLRLDVPAGATIADLAGLNVSNLPFTSGQAYTVNRGGGSLIPTPMPPVVNPTPTPMPPVVNPTPTPMPPVATPTPPGGGAPVRVYLPLAQR
ncbi:MAG: hypothetical protein RMK84_10590 [Oscillochloridaceae bacterium]|nr:hypothetical protein [Oscillochloridaceae bacterium]